MNKKYERSNIKVIDHDCNHDHGDFYILSRQSVIELPSGLPTLLYVFTYHNYAIQAVEDWYDAFSAGKCISYLNSIIEKCA